MIARTPGLSRPLGEPRTPGIRDALLAEMKRRAVKDGDGNYAKQAAPAQMNAAAHPQADEAVEERAEKLTAGERRIGGDNPREEKAEHQPNRSVLKPRR